MTCKRIDFPGGMSFSCSRGVRSEPCGCGTPHTALCDYPLTGAKTGQTCDRKLCDKCRVRGGEGRDYCRVHAALPPPTIARPVAVVGPRSFRALHLVCDVVSTYAPNVRVVSGHAAGVDIVAEITAHQRGRATSIYPVKVPANASRATFAKAAFARNTSIAHEGMDADVFLNAEARGTRDTLHKLRALGKEVRIHEEPHPSEHALLFHTAVHPNTRQAPRGYRGPSMLDITRGTGGAAGHPFAPSEELLSEVRRRMANDGPAAFDWYRTEFVAEMRRSWVNCRPAWDALLARNHVVLACYCPPPAPGAPDSSVRCHRRILAELLVKAGERVGRRVVDGGEVRLPVA